MIENSYETKCLPVCSLCDQVLVRRKDIFYVAELLTGKPFSLKNMRCRLVDTTYGGIVYTLYQLTCQPA